MKIKKLLAVIVAMAMTVGMMSSLAFADEAENTPEETDVAETLESKEKEDKITAEEKTERAEEKKTAEAKTEESSETAETEASEKEDEETAEPSESFEAGRDLKKEWVNPNFCVRQKI